MDTLKKSIALLLLAMIPTLASAGGFSCSVALTPVIRCTEVTGSAQSSCFNPSDTYSSGSCPTTGLLAKCDINTPFPEYAHTDYYYNGIDADYLSDLPRNCRGDGGVYTSLSGSSGTAGISNAQFFAWAEGAFPGIFSGTPVAGQQQTYDYRYYPGSQIYLAVETTSESVYGLIGSTGTVVPLGALSAFASTVTAWEATQAATPPATGGAVISACNAPSTSATVCQELTYPAGSNPSCGTNPSVVNVTSCRSANPQLTLVGVCHADVGVPVVAYYFSGTYMNATASQSQCALLGGTWSSN